MEFYCDPLPACSTASRAHTAPAMWISHAANVARAAVVRVYAEMCRWYLQSGMLSTHARSLCLDAIFTSSSRSKRDAITKTRMGTDLRNAGNTCNAQSQSDTDVISYFPAAHTRGTSASNVGTSGSGTG